MLLLWLHAKILRKRFHNKMDSQILLLLLKNVNARASSYAKGAIKSEYVNGIGAESWAKVQRPADFELLEYAENVPSFFIVALSHSLDVCVSIVCAATDTAKVRNCFTLSCIFSLSLFLLSYSSAIIIFTAYFSRFILAFICSYFHSFILSSFQFFFHCLLSRHLLATFSRSGFRLTTKYQYYLKRC